MEEFGVGHGKALGRSVLLTLSRSSEWRMAVIACATFRGVAAALERGVPDPLSTMQFILAGGQMIFGHDVFAWTAEEMKARQEAMILLMERALGAAPGSIARAIQRALLREARRGRA
jgi:hypothetical protein